MEIEVGQSSGFANGEKDGIEWVFIGFGKQGCPDREMQRYIFTPAKARWIAAALLEEADNADARLNKQGEEKDDGWQEKRRQAAAAAWGDDLKEEFTAKLLNLDTYKEQAQLATEAILSPALIYLSGAPDNKQRKKVANGLIKLFAKKLREYVSAEERINRND